MTRNNLPTIVLTAFGASSPAAREVYGHIEAYTRNAFPDHDIAWAYLSHKIVEKQRRRGVLLPTLQETLDSLVALGRESVIMQPLLVTPGEEFAALKAVTHPDMEIVHGEPLLSNQADIEAAIAAFASTIQASIPHILVCHGNKRCGQFNEPLMRLKEAAEHAFENLVVASIEGSPGQEPLERARLLAKEHGSVVFMPFMIVAGEHVAKDVMGDEPDSWRNIVGARHTVCLEPLGRNSEILNIYMTHLRSALCRMETGNRYD